MIRLKYILLESKQIPNVLFVSDNGIDKTKGYARKLISSGVVTGEVYTADQQPADELVSLVYYNLASGYYDAVVIQCSGLYDDDVEFILDKLQLIDNICKRKQIQPIFITIPTDRFVKDDKYTPIDYIKVNSWIESTGTYVDLSKINDDIYFTKSGMRLDKLGNAIIYNQLKLIFSTYGKEVETLPIQSEKDIKQLRSVQRALNKLGYTIDSKELRNIKLGSTTEKAIKEFQLKNSLPPTGEINKQTLTKLFSTTAIAANFSDEPEVKKKVKKRVTYTGENTNAMQVMQFLIDKGLSVAGAAGIAGNMKIESNFKTDAEGDHGTSIGLVQWHASNKDALFNWCEQKNMDPLTYEAQMAFLWFELKTKFKSLLVYLQSTQDARDAALTFAEKFERPAVISPKRMDYAEEFFNEYSAQGGPIGTLTSIWNNVKNAATVGTIMALGTADQIRRSNSFDIPAGASLLSRAVKINANSPKNHASRPLGNWQSDNAWDIFAPSGTKVYSITSGVVLKIGGNENKHAGKIFGAQVTVKGKNGYPDIFYTHLTNIQVSKGDKIQPGTLIGEITRWDNAPSSEHVHIGMPYGTSISSLVDMGTGKIKS